jgi:hypothetical protein
MIRSWLLHQIRRPETFRGPLRTNKSTFPERRNKKWSRYGISQWLNITHLCITYTQRMQWTLNREGKSVRLSCHLPNHLTNYYNLTLTVHTNTRQITPLSSVLFQNYAVANWLTYYPLLVQPKTSLPCSQKPLLDQTNSLLSLIYHLFKIRCNVKCLSTRSCNTTVGIVTGI